jgi:Tfp pilus assembly protein PilF
MGFDTPPVAAAAARALYLQARVLWNRRTPAAIKEAIRQLQRAIVLDGPFPLASAALADCFSLLLDYGIVSPGEGLTAARLAAGRALHHAPHLPESHTASALVRHMDLDWKGAEAEFRAAIQVHPGYAPARQRYALFLIGMGRYLESRREMDRALALDPHTPAISASLAWVEYYGGRFSHAVEAAQETLTRHPEFSAAQAALASALVQLGQPGRAASLLESSLSREPENVALLALLCSARAAEGSAEEARILLGRLRGSSSRRHVSPYYLAMALLGTEGEEGALRALEDAVTEGSPQLAYLAVEPGFSALRNREPFQAIVRRIDIPAGISPMGAGPRKAPEPPHLPELRPPLSPRDNAVEWQSSGLRSQGRLGPDGLPMAEAG